MHVISILSGARELAITHLFAIALLLVPLADRLGAQSPTPPDPTAIVAARDRMAMRAPWPGFDPRAYPLAIFDGTRTVLVGHPAPPAPFVPVPGKLGYFVMPGRHPAVTANSSDTIAGVMTATVMPFGPRATAAEIAGVTVHEAFHVYQRAKHPGWSANEADAFTYSNTDVPGLAARRREYALLRLALGTKGKGDATCHLAVALSERNQRFARMNAEHAAYERKSELNEGLAQYVQWRAMGVSDARAVPDSLPEPGAVRAHAYHVGPAWGRLLDRFAPHWRNTLGARDTLSLDALLLSAVGWVETERPRCGLPPELRTRIDADADHDVAQLKGMLAREREEFDRVPGPRLEVVADRALLMPMGFDPLNVARVAAVTVLHKRYVQAGNRAGSIEVIGRQAMTEGAGAHPLFNGIKALTITGLDASFAVRATGDTTVISAVGVNGRFVRARVERAGDTTRVLLAP